MIIVILLTIGMKAASDAGVVAGECGGGALGLLFALREYVGQFPCHSPLRELVDEMFAKESVVLCVNTEADTDPEIYQRIVDEKSQI